MKTEELLERLHGDSPVKVIHGANDGLFDIAGTTVATLWASLSDVFNIPADALAFVNGDQVDPSYRLLSSDTVEFVKQYGEKSILDPEEKAQLDRIESMLNRLFVKPADHLSPGDYINGIITNISTTSGSLAFGPIRVNQAENEVTVSGKTFPVDTVLLAVMTCLVEANGNWVTRTDMKAKSRILQVEERLDRIILRLTTTIKALAPLIESSSRGYRLFIPINLE